MTNMKKLKVIALSIATVSAGWLAHAVWGVSQETDVAIAKPLQVQMRSAFDESTLKEGYNSEFSKFQQQLEANLASLKESHTRLGEQQTMVVAKDTERREELVRVEHLLACFKNAHHQGKNIGFPQMVFTQCFNETQIRDMVQRLLDRQSELKGAENRSSDQLLQAMAQLQIRITETKRHLDNIPVYLALAIAGDSSGKSDTIRESLTNCLNSNHQYLAKKPAIYMPTNTEMTGVAASEIPSADRFLVGNVVAKPCNPSDPLPTVSELTSALKSIIREKP